LSREEFERALNCQQANWTNQAKVRAKHLDKSIDLDVKNMHLFFLSLQNAVYVSFFIQ
jgi:hypothetical protein